MVNGGLLAMRFNMSDYDYVQCALNIDSVDMNTATANIHPVLHAPEIRESKEMRLIGKNVSQTLVD